MAIEIFGFITGLIYLFYEIKQRKFMWVVGGVSAAAYIIVFYEKGLYATMGMQVYYLIMSIYGWYEWRKNSCNHNTSITATATDISAITATANNNAATDTTTTSATTNNNAATDTTTTSATTDNNAATNTTTNIDTTANNNTNGADDNVIYIKKLTSSLLIWSISAFSVLMVAIYFLLKKLDGDPMPLTDALTTSLSIIATWWLSRCIIYQWWIWVFVDIIIAVLCFYNDLILSGVLYLLFSIFAIYGYKFWKSEGVRL